ncbi:prepilin-type N-terminal cleavage/methylation domain-containing protein [Halanaerobium salsuginis]|jgi:prepilin-type N-terminal cleavage/methylation domain-containing protein|uniref:Prepilin-type N-terminal cleavage/methylation domain-containing protein n=1 Tax=Halanaerobium salsuginis TaxID=29563 RepID=A0A1I4ETC8_9FIRM|nr:GspH/FimT family pseudopilin [Halanaerobium salsuginis]SFL08954.1 prepilin-type N-terminal cleavage/methylation domain-containing protein [Halanaerobium salsuginis]
MEKLIKNKQGFTLLELLFILIIISIMMSFALPVVHKDDFTMKQLVRKLALDFRWARNKAILDNQCYIFKIYSINPDSNQERIPYYFYIEKDGKEIIKRKGSYPANLILYKTQNYQPVTENYYDWIRFNSTATARASTIAFSRPENNSKKYAITINQLGRIKIEE